MGSLSILFRQYSYPVILRKILRKPQVRYSSLVFFSGGFNSSFRCWSCPFSSFQMLSHAGVSPNLSLLAIQGFRSVEELLEDSRFHSQPLQGILRLLSHSSHLIQPVQSPFQVIVQRCFSWVGPNPQVFSQDLTWLFYFPGVTLNSSPSLM